jgi:hypothetical protein
MKIGVVSDTHRNIENLESVINWLARRHHITALYHLGDDHEDTASFADRYVDIVHVPGTYHAGYRDGSLEKKKIETVLGLRILLVHAMEQDVGSDDRMHADIILNGHTHKAEMHLADGLFFMNPGHLKGPLDKNMPPSFGLLDIHDKEVTAEIYNLDFKPIQSMRMGRTEGGLHKL